jgi:hypothetical protein
MPLLHHCQRLSLVKTSSFLNNAQILDIILIHLSYLAILCAFQSLRFQAWQAYTFMKLLRNTLPLFSSPLYRLLVHIFFINFHSNKSAQ